MTLESDVLDQMVTTLVPSLSKSLAERFNVFRVMHHGTHEKQLSNVFAWLLRPDATHGLGDGFQRIFADQVNRWLPEELRLPESGYEVQQEVDTSGPDLSGRDIADITLTRADARIVVENYESSDGHGHDYGRYFAYATMGDSRGVVVLLCHRREAHRQTNGWEHAVVISYAELLEPLAAHLERDRMWRGAHPQQHMFLNQLFDHFLEGVEAVSTEDRIAFIKAMCETGESARYGYRPQDAAAEEFATLLARHAKRRFEDGRATLAQVKRNLKRYAEQVLMGQVNDVTHTGGISLVQAKLQGKWEWCVALRRGEGTPAIFLEFGPTAAFEIEREPGTVQDVDYSKIFVVRKVAEPDPARRIVQSDVGLDEVVAGLRDDDLRLRDLVLDLVRSG